MPTSHATIPPHTAPALMEDYIGAAIAAMHRQIETALLVQLAALPPGDRRLFRAELAEIHSGMEGDTSARNLTTIVLECDPPKTWLVERGSDDDNLTDEQATMLIRAGAVLCQFASDDPKADCGVALCDFHHPEAWL